ncbi:succinate dehydrogenase assembly factor 2 [Polymorphobacter sp. PAMC 29334]|uniref:succinate dehydrogenase assembly factor 2 n=1 Tax=Polymorphobacter sp. PAMC 29334 TaxID=2862331 RepID=UPI00351CF243
MAMNDLEFRQRRLAFRAWHRGTREADLMIGGFADRHAASWGIAEIDWFEALLEEQDVDIMAWAIGKAVPPERFEGEQMAEMRKLDYIARSMR